jgi:putative DNA primase/helicase
MGIAPNPRHEAPNAAEHPSADKGKSAERKSITADIERLARIDPIEFAQVRKDQAKALDITTANLDKLVSDERKKLKAAEDADERRKRVRLAASAKVHELNDGRTRLPEGYRYTRDGSIEHLMGGNSFDGAEEWKRLCSPIEFMAMTEDTEKKRPGLLVRIRTHSGHWHRIAFPNSALVGGDDLLRELMDHGLRVNPSGKDGNALKRLLITVVATNQARCVNRVGWHEDTFVLPDEVIGNSEGMEVVYQPTAHPNHYYGVAGTLEAWQSEVAANAAGNSRMELAICVALAGPLLRFAEIDGGGFHLFGTTSVGKSTALWAAGSTWGGGGKLGFAHSWRSTDNGVEGTAAVHNDGCLLLDEMGQATGKVVSETSYMLANGKGKNRSGPNGHARRTLEWNMMFLSTGESTLSAKIAADGGHVMAGQETRLVDIPADGGAGMGLFENIHGFASPELFANHIRKASNRNYGHASRAFLREIVKDVPSITARLLGDVNAFAACLCPEGAASEVGRVARRFALVACAGELAIELGILPWEPETAGNAVIRCFNDWLQARGGATKREDRSAIDAAIGFISRHASRFCPWERPETVIHDRAGFTQEHGDGSRTFYVFKSVFDVEVCGKQGIDPGIAADALSTHGMLRKSSDGKRTRRERLPKLGHERVYCITLKDEGGGE